MMETEGQFGDNGRHAGKMPQQERQPVRGRPGQEGVWTVRDRERQELGCTEYRALDTRLRGSAVSSYAVPSRQEAPSLDQAL